MHIHPQLDAEMDRKERWSWWYVYYFSMSIITVVIVFPWLPVAMSQLSAAKCRIMSDVVHESGGFYSMPVEVPFRSRVNFAIRITREGECNEELEKKFLKEAAVKGLVALKGYRTVGGLRVSLYNACSEEDTRKLASFMREFMKENKLWQLVNNFF